MKKRTRWIAMLLTGAMLMAPMNVFAAETGTETEAQTEAQTVAEVDPSLYEMIRRLPLHTFRSASSVRTRIPVRS